MIFRPHLTRALKSLTLFALMLSLSACLTTRLYQESSYKERVSSILFSQDGKSLVVIGKKHHYIFDSPEIINKALEKELHQHMEAGFSGFTLYRDNRISGNFELTIAIDAPDYIKERALHQLGFQAGSMGYIRLTGSLTGVRYKANGINAQLRAQQLNREYQVNIKMEPGMAYKSVRAALTPVTLATDGVLTIASVPLGMSALLVTYVGCALSEQDCKM